MAKKNRMGRNLNALLGGATGSRAASRAAQTSAATEQETPSVDESTVERNDSKDQVSQADQAKTAAVTPISSSVSDAESTAFIEPITTSTASVVDDQSAANSALAPSDFSADSSTSAASSDLHSGTQSQTGSTSFGVEPLPADSHPSDRLRMLGVDQITRGTYQPRRHFDQDLLQELADSIKAQGLIQPILVRAYAGKFELIAGERRWRASQLAGITDIPAIVRDMDDQSVAAVSLIENIQRADLNPLEEAQALERLCGEFSMTHQQVAEAVGRSRVAVTNLMRLLELHTDVKDMVDDGELDMGHARALLGAPHSEQSGIAKRIVEQGLTVRAVEKLVKDLRDGKTPTTSAAAKSDPNIEALGQKLGKKLGAPVSIRHQRNGSGKLEISYSSIDELEGILSHIK